MRSIILFSAVLVTSIMSTPLVYAEICSSDVTGDAAVTPIDALMIIEKINEVCGTSIRMDCLEICCDVNGDGDCTPEDADLVMSRFLNPAGNVPFEEIYLKNQYQAQQTLIDLVGRMRQYQSEFGAVTNSVGDLGIEVKKGALYDYEILNINNVSGEYTIKAISKAPGIGKTAGPETMFG